MKEITVDRLSQEAEVVLDDAQRERLLVTRNGKPVALIVGLENKDQEDFELENSAEFWRMIEERRHRPSVRLADVEATLFPDDDSQGETATAR